MVEITIINTEFNVFLFHYHNIFVIFYSKNNQYFYQQNLNLPNKQTWLIRRKKFALSEITAGNLTFPSTEVLKSDKFWYESKPTLLLNFSVFKLWKLENQRQ